MDGKSSSLFSLSVRRVVYLLQEVRKHYFKKTFWAEEYISVLAHRPWDRERGRGEEKRGGERRRADSISGLFTS